LVSKILRVAALVALSMLVSACAVVPYDPYNDAPVSVAPPAALVEYPGYPPAADYLWMNGFWNWGSGHYVWGPGRWESDARARPVLMAVSRSGARSVPEREAR
jgi:hypothetical protein